MDNTNFPASFAQQRLWLIEQLEPNKPIYNLPAAYKVTGDLSLNILGQSLHEIVRRHEALRTTFSSVDGQLRQLVHPDARLDFQTVDLGYLANRAREAEAARLVHEEISRPFDITRGPLLRVTVFHLGNDRYILLFVMHHMISDGSSLEILLRELSIIYSAFAAKRPSPLPELPIQYVDFTLWQRERMAEGFYRSQLEYWKRKLRTIPPLIDLPTDYPRPAAQTYRGGRHTFSVPVKILEALKDFSRRQEVTLFITVLTAFKVLLHRFSNQQTIVVGVPVAGRNEMELEEIIGFFVNMLVLPTDFSGNPSFMKLLRRVRENTLEAYSHQDLPFDKLVEELRPERHLSRSPLFQVMIQERSPTTKSTEQLAGLTLEEFEFETGIAKYDLALDFTEKSNGLFCLFRYNLDLFKPASIRQMAERFRTLLGAIVENPTERISDLAVMAQSDQDLLLKHHRATSSASVSVSTVSQLFEAQVGRSPDALAVVFAESAWTYRELNDRANQLATRLKRLGVGPDILVGLCLRRSPEVLAAILGVWKAGGAYVPLDPQLPKSRLAHILQDTEIGLLVAQKSLLSELPIYHGKIVLVDGCGETEVAQLYNGRGDSAAGRENLAYVMYTSGSTGKPKGVMTCHGGAVDYLSCLPQAYRFGSSDIVLQLPSFSFDASVRDLIGPLVAGARVVMVDENEATNPSALVSKIKQQRVTCLFSVVPVMLRALVDCSTDGLASLGLVLVSGEPLPLELCRRARERFGPGALLVNQYGPTESTMTSTYYPVGDSESDGDIAPIGRPISTANIYILDQYLNLSPPGVPGELCTEGTGLARGYLNAPDLTAEKFIPNPFSRIPGSRLYRTGDLARLRDDGTIEFSGRIDHQVKVRGYRIELGEVEAALREFPQIGECVVAARDDGLGGKYLVAYIARDGNTALDRAEIGSFLRQTLPGYMVPSQFCFLDQLPLTPNRKVDRNALPNPEELAVKPELMNEPRTPIQTALAAIWHDVLNPNRLSIYDNFFNLGGHSLHATQVMSRINSCFHIDLPLRRLFEAPTIASLARCIEEETLSTTTASAPLRAVVRRQQFPLSFAQQRLWFLAQLEPFSPVYNIAAALRASGPMDVATLERSLNEIVRRHESLRTSFSSVDGEPFQCIASSVSARIPLIDLTSLAETERESEALRIVTDEAGRSFDLAEAPLLRLRVLRLDKTEHILLLTMHHITSDGWSLDILFRELSALYAASLGGFPSPLPDLPIQYADFALWQREWLTGEVLEKQIAYWRQKLQGSPSMLQLPTNRSTRSIQSFKGSRQLLTLPGSLREALCDLSRTEGVTLFMTLLSGFQVLLHRYSGEEDIVIGSPIANRNRSEIEPLIGFFANTLVLRGDLSGNPTFRQLLKRTSEVCLEAYAHQDLPFEKLVEELEPRRDLTRNPLFQVMFVFQKDPVPALKIAGLTFRPLRVERDLVKFDLSLAIVDGEELRAVLVYNTELFDQLTVRRMLGHWQSLLERIAVGPDRKISALSVLAEQERNQLLLEWNRPTSDEPGRQLVHQLFEFQVERTPQATAVVARDNFLTYDDLNRRANQLARYLRKLGVGPESMVVICIDRCFEMVLALLGVLKSGGAYVPVDPDCPAERLAFILDDVRPAAVLTRRSWAAKFSMVQSPIVFVDENNHNIAGESVENPANAATPENLAYVIYTSGSTGSPKGVLTEHRQILNYVKSFQEQCDIGEQFSFAMVQPLYVDASQSVIFPALGSGGCLHVVPDAIASEPASMNDYFRSYPVDLLKLAPCHLAALLCSRDPENLLPRKRLVLGGEPFDWSLVDSIHAMRGECVIFNHYGPTETTVGVATFRIEDAANDVRRGTVPLGRPMPNSQMYILDDYLEPVPVGAAGYMYIGGAGLARGYLKRPDLTAENYIPNPFSDQPGTRLYRTGDRGRYLADGNIEFLGRKDGQVKIRGFRVELAEIEIVLRRHPGIDQVAVVVKHYPSAEPHIIAYIVARRGPQPSARELAIFLSEKLPSCMSPDAFVFLDRLPRTSHGKLDPRGLPMPDTLPKTESFTAPRDRVEEMLARIWAEVLALESVGIYDNFFDLGGHSLKAMQLASKISAAMNREIPVKALFTYPTIASMAEVIRDPASSKERAYGTEIERNSLTDTSSPGELGREIASSMIIERRSLLSLLAAGRMPPIDAAALGYLPTDLVATTGLSREEIIDDWHEGLPTLSAIMETCLGRVGIVILPVFASELYSDPKRLLAATLDGLELSHKAGARVVSLTGLIPSATDYGRALATMLAGRDDLPAVSTGHATTVSTVVLAIDRILREAGREMNSERVGFLGVGSIGLATLELMLKCLPHPNEILLCDIYNKRELLMEIAGRVRQLGFCGSVHVVQSSAKIPAEFYQATLIVGASNVPDILDIDELKSGTIVVDDSGPHCFNIEAAIDRFKARKDILFTEGGVLLAPQPIRRVRWLPRFVEERAKASYVQRLPSHYPSQITGCVLSSLLSFSFPELTPTLGLVDSGDSVRHYQRLSSLGFVAAALHCRDFILPSDCVTEFRHKYGRT
jgi:amino acid adenylation domain-containing protein